MLRNFIKIARKRLQYDICIWWCKRYPAKFLPKNANVCRKWKLGKGCVVLEGFILRMEGISKQFPGVKALDEAQLRVKRGEVHALMGENGAGKSTLMKVLNGLLAPDNGKIYLNNAEIKLHNTVDALKNGIAMIYQELNPIRDMSVAENVFLGREFTIGNGFFVNKKKCEEETEQLLKKFGLDVNPNAKMRSLSIAEMQMIEIMKAVSTGAKIIVMDEPTSSLTDDEIRVLFQKIKELKREGLSLIHI